jgi:hypothetical protein
MRVETILMAGFALFGHALPTLLTVDLGYEKYTGVYNKSTDFNTWKGCVAV